MVFLCWSCVIMKLTCTSVHCELTSINILFFASLQKRGYQRGAWPPNEAPGHQTRQWPVSQVGLMSTRDWHRKYTILMHQNRAFSMSIPCTRKTRLYHWPLWMGSGCLKFFQSQSSAPKKFSLTRSIHQKSLTTTTAYCMYCVPITASPGGGRAGGDSGVDIQMTQKIHQNRAFSMSIPCTHKIYLWQRSLWLGPRNHSDRCHK